MYPKDSHPYETFAPGPAQPRSGGSAREETAADPRPMGLEATVFLDELRLQYGRAFQEKLDTLMRAYEFVPQTVAEMLDFLRTLTRYAEDQLHNRLKNPYINAEMGEARELYVEILRERYEAADDLLQMVMSADYGFRRRQGTGTP